jgi:nucleotide-binding universal stress UspA family protein
MSPPQTIAVGFDGSPDAEAAVRWTLKLANRLGSDVVFVHAAGLLEHIDAPVAVTELEERAWVLASEAGLDPTRGRWHVGEGDPCTVLLRAADPPIAADLVVVGSRRRGAHTGLLLGSTSHELAEHSSVPVVIVPSGTARGV